MFRRKLDDSHSYAPGSKVIPAMRIDVPMPVPNGIVSDETNRVPLRKSEAWGGYQRDSRVVPAMRIDIPMPKLKDSPRNPNDGNPERQGGTLVQALRETYGEGFAPAPKPDETLDVLLERERAGSLSELLKRA